MQRLVNAWPQTQFLGLVKAEQEAFAVEVLPALRYLPVPEKLDQQGAMDAAGDQGAAKLLNEIDAFGADLIISAAAKPSPLSLKLLSSAKTARKIVPVSFHEEIRKCARFKTPHVEEGLLGCETPLGTPNPAQWECMHDLADRLLGESAPRNPPKLSAEKKTEERTLSWLKTAGLVSGEFIVCGLGDRDDSSSHVWPPDRIASVSDWLWRERHLRVLLVGGTGNLALLENARRHCSERAPAVWTGDSADAVTLAALVRHSRLFFGFECGAMHLAAALEKPVAAIFGGGNWPQARPAAARSIELHAPLPCYGCEWDCVLVDAPCVRQVSVGAVIAAISDLHSSTSVKGNEIRAQPWPPGFPVDLLAKVSEKHSMLGAELQRLKAERTDLVADLSSEEARAEKLHEGLAAQFVKFAEQERESATLRAACNERAELVDQLNREKQILQKEQLKSASELAAMRRGNAASIEKAHEIQARYEKLSPDATRWAQDYEDRGREVSALRDKLEKLGEEFAQLRSTLDERERSLRNVAAGLGTFEMHEYYRRQLHSKDDAIFELRRELHEQRALFALRSKGKPTFVSRLRTIDASAETALRKHLLHPLENLFWKQFVTKHWMQLGKLQQYDACLIAWDSPPSDFRTIRGDSPRIGIVTPSLNQKTSLERTLTSVLSQDYSNLYYVLQDGLSTDGSIELIRRHASALHAWQSEENRGPAQALARGFDKLAASLLPEDVMAWLGAGDLLAPGALALVGRYFAAHPRIDAVYGHRILIDGDDREIGRWIFPRHERGCFDYWNLLPKESFFWRKRAWDKVGGINPELRTCLSWDLFIRMENMGAKIARLPAFLGAHRVNGTQNPAKENCDEDEQEALLERLHGLQPDPLQRETAARRLQRRGAIYSQLMSLGIRL
jgi:ADP-heptose:LPS heptosyltransferase